MRIVLEVVQGEGGYVPAPTAFVKELRRICDEHGIMLIVDEVQSGMGRTGKMFALDHHEGVKPTSSAGERARIWHADRSLHRPS